MIKKYFYLLSLWIIAGFVGVLGAATLPGTATAKEVVSSIARGGMLYDNWYTVLKAGKPKENHPLWPTANTQEKGANTWRCASCHGWDLKGDNGMPGLTKLKDADPAKVIAVLKGKKHAMADEFSQQDLTDLANFITKGQFDVDKYIDRASGKAKGNKENGVIYYNTICAKCHGLDGKKPKDWDSVMGAITNESPWEALHKIMNGEPGEVMPALRAFGPQLSADILSYAQTLPNKR
ncbi:c-type cytochrome [Varunaivibrio sulfuroxidans]|uniref:Cbb3-type cytochrome c oxidase subunit III n=1 Tax=Varunaivibrio sulfuroxidans TaxID=1773489 RepID=A0A4R3JCX8_9PROT|nr:c-type cytochrome [Varunaivibrio sulfuroxidans]TCS63524.1 cbb3-type cytochrome c oxidase subunit III [Varunaivibrio sulfuroxidans]WES30331.1 c-type cytochrome [Varunaivibrio sulfuroxidans]